MSLNVNNHSCASPYSENPAIRPLLAYNNLIKIVLTKKLPDTGKLLALVKRIVLVATAPLAYLVLSLLAFAGVLTHSFQDKSVKVKQTGPQINVEQETNKSVELLIKEIDDCFSNFNRKITSFKLFMDIVVDGKKYQREEAYCDSTGCWYYFLGSTKEMLRYVPERFIPEKTAQVDIHWQVLVKFKDGNKDEYATFRVSNNGNFDNENKPISGKCIVKNIQAFTPLFLKQTGRPDIPQVNANGDFK